MFTETSILEFKATLRGILIEPHDSNYHDVRKVYNAAISRLPRMIVMCYDVADVIRSVNFARENNMLLAIRSGGHNAWGSGICDEGMVIDLSNIRYTKINPENKTVIVGAGCKWGEVDHATHAFGMAVPSGIISTTGVGGLTLGGGLGYLTRKYGLTIDNLLAVDMVLADGSFITANADQNQDLYWAVRGGGGNFGVVTAFTYKLQPVSLLYGGPMLYEMDEAEDVMKWYREYIKNANDDMNGFFAFLTVPPHAPFPEHLQNKKMCGIVWSCTLQMEKAEKAFEPIRNFRKAAFDLVGPIPHPVMQSLFDGLIPPGLQWYWRADFVNELSDEAIQKHIQYGYAMPTALSTMHLYPINGAASRIGKKDTAWSYRDATWAMVIAGIDPDPGNKDVIAKWSKDYWEALHPHSAGGAYVNFMMNEGEDRVKASYKENYERLSKIKAKYDPENLFRMNQNIKPVMEKMVM